MKNFHQRIDWDAQVLAELSGIAAGWQAGVENPRYRVACEVCEIECSFELSPLQARYGKYHAEQEAEVVVWKMFTRSAEIQPCPHLGKYYFWRDNPGTQAALRQLALERLKASLNER